MGRVTSWGAAVARYRAVMRIIAELCDAPGGAGIVRYHGSWSLRPPLKGPDRRAVKIEVVPTLAGEAIEHGVLLCESD
jgi:hypothetical protein